MKFVKRITVFFIIPMTMFAGGLASGMAAMDFFYPGRALAEGNAVAGNRITDSWETAITEGAEAADIAYENQVDKNTQSGQKAGRPDGSGTGSETDPDTGSVTASMEESLLSAADAGPEAVEVSMNDGATINADTEYMIQEYRRNSDEMSEEIIPVPETFVGLDRELFTTIMEEFTNFPPLSEQEKGFISCEVVSFSPHRVVVRKIYEEEETPEEMAEGFYLVNENNLVTVYYGDEKTVYMTTNIMLQNLPEELREEIIYRKFIEREEDLYDFLEAYSS